MSKPHADRNLLFGILALQMDFITRDALVAAMNAWVIAKEKPLGEILLGQGALREDAHALLEALVQKHLEMHGDDAERSLAALSSLGSVREQLRQVADPEVAASLAHVSAAREDDPYATRPPSVGMPTSAGLRFRILRPHARGGLGEVFVAHDEELHREVALKEIQGNRADDPQSRARFLLEAEVTGGLEHPGIVPVYGLGCYADGRPFYAMRFIRGDTLHDAIKQFHSPDAKRADAGERSVQMRKLLGRFLDVCNAMEYAHSRGVLHRDLKPGNIMLGKYGETLVVDWGLAKPQGAGGSAEDAPEGALRPGAASDVTPTQAGAAVGTPEYMSPEQAAGRLEQLGSASDVYSLGATLYCLLTGRAPFRGDDVGTVLRQVQRGDLPRPREVAGGIPAALEAVCVKAMALRPEDRYASPRVLADDVEHWLADEPVTAWREPWLTRAGRWARRNKTLVSSALAVLLTAILGLAAGVVMLEREREAAVAAEGRARASALLAQTERDKAEEQRGRAEMSYRLAREALGKCMELKQDPRLRSGEMQQLQVKLAQAEAAFYQQFVQLRGEGPAFQAERAGAFLDLADVTNLLGKPEEAVEHCKQAVALYRELARGDHSPPAYRERLVACFDNLGTFYGRLARWEDAERVVDEANANASLLSRTDPESPSYQLLLAQTSNSLGVVYRNQNRIDKAEECHKTAVEILEKIARLHPDPSYRRHLAAGYHGLATFYLYHRSGHLPEAQTGLERALNILEELVRQEPSEPDEEMLGHLYRPLADLYKRSRKFGDAENLIIQKALPFLAKRAERHPAVPDYQFELATIYDELHLVYKFQGRLESSQVPCQQSLSTSNCEIL